MRATEHRGAWRWIFAGFGLSLLATVGFLVRGELERARLERLEHESQAELAACPAREAVSEFKQALGNLETEIAILQELASRQEDEEPVFQFLSALSAGSGVDLQDAQAEKKQLRVRVFAAGGERPEALTENLPWQRGSSPGEWWLQVAYEDLPVEAPR